MADREQLGFGFHVEDEATQPLGEIENAYIQLTKTMDATMRSISKSMKNFSDRLEDAGDSANDAEKQERKQVSRLGEMGDALKDGIVGLDKFGVSWNNVVKLLTAVSIGGAILGIITFFKRAAEKAHEFRKEMAELNEVYQMTARDSREVSGTVLSLADYAGKTRDEVRGMTRAMLDIGLIPSAARDAGTSFRELAKVTLQLSAATGTSTESAAELTDQLLRINKVPANNIRSIGYSIKNVADQTRITTDELLQFNKGLEPLFAMLQDQSGAARATFTQNMTGIAGALSDVNIDASKATSQFAEMLDETSAEGQKALGQLASFTGLDTGFLKELIKNDPSAIFDQLAKTSANLSPDQLKLMARSLQPLGLEFADLTRLADKFGKQGSQSFKDRVKEISALNAKDDALAKAAQKRQDSVSAIQNRFSRVWENVMIKIGGAVLDNLAEPFMKVVVPMLEKFVKWLGSINWEQVFKTLSDAISDITLAFKVVGSFVKDVFEGVGMAIGYFASTAWEDIKTITEFFTNAWDKAFSAVTGGFRAITDWFQDKFDRVILWLANSIAPMITKFAKWIPGFDGTAIADALKGVAASAQQRVDEREGKAPATSTVPQALATAGRGSPSVSIAAPGVDMPSTMKTMDPVAQRLLQENNAIQKDIRNELRRKGKGASSIKSAAVLQMAGAT